MRKDFLFILVCVMAVLTVGCGSDQALKKAEKYYAIGEYYEAAAQYKKAYSQTPIKEKARRGQISAKLAECYRKTSNTSRAITAYNNVIRNKQADSLTHLRLAQQLMKNGSYKEAAKNFQAAIDSLTACNLSTVNYLSLAKNGLKSAQQAPQ